MSYPQQQPNAMSTSDASIGKRVGALLLDALIVGIPAGIILGLIFGAPTSPFSLSYWLVSIVTYGYFFVMESRDGQTVGKKIVGIRVVADGGGRPDSQAILMRTLLRIVDGLFLYLVGFIVAMVSDKNQRLGDMVGSTRVVDA